LSEKEYVFKGNTHNLLNMHHRLFAVYCHSISQNEYQKNLSILLGEIVLPSYLLRCFKAMVREYGIEISGRVGSGEEENRRGCRNVLSLMEHPPKTF